MVGVCRASCFRRRFEEITDAISRYYHILYAIILALNSVILFLKFYFDLSLANSVFYICVLISKEQCETAKQF